MNRITVPTKNPEKTRDKNTITTNIVKNSICGSIQIKIKTSGATTKTIKSSCSQAIKLIPLICILITTTTTKILGGGFLDTVYQDALNLAQSNTKAATTAMQNFNPQEAFKNKDGTSYYTDSPSQTQHYQDITQGNAVLLEDAGRKKIDDNEATKAAYSSFNNLKIKIDPKEPWLSRSKDIIQNASAITTGISSNPGEPVTPDIKAGINCKEAKVCRVDLVKKTCNEEANSIKRICEKIPKINSFVKETIYPNCQHLVITTGRGNSCPSGYSQLLHTGEIRIAVFGWTEARLCTKSISPQDNIECYFGKYYIGINQQGSERATIPKKFHSRIKFSNVHGSETKATIINETTGQTLYNEGTFSNGQVIELPYSDIQDQTFRFYVIPSPGFMVWDWKHIGVMALYINSKYLEQEASLESWQEVNCSEM